MQLQQIEWEDTTCIAEWHDREELTQFIGRPAFVVSNVGYVVHEDDDCVVLAARMAQTGDHFGLIERIPKRAILRRYGLASLGRLAAP